jgi:hypothetical protein
MEKINLVIAFIVRRVTIEAFVLSQNANNTHLIPFNKCQIIRIVFMGLGR